MCATSDPTTNDYMGVLQTLLLVICVFPMTADPNMCTDTWPSICLVIMLGLINGLTPVTGAKDYSKLQMSYKHAYSML